jgi:sterol desaturase/sphingolipid hydroxylase (fatty acid hydroxylase superfamily)
MREQIGFLKISSAVVKVAAWIFLFLGFLGGVSLLLGAVPGNPRWMGIIILVFYFFIFFFFYFTARIADLLVKLVNEAKADS